MKVGGLNRISSSCLEKLPWRTGVRALPHTALTTTHRGAGGNRTRVLNRSACGFTVQSNPFSPVPEHCATRS